MSTILALDASERKRGSWNKGLTKLTDARVLAYSIKLNVGKMWMNGVAAMAAARRGKPSWNKGLTKTSDERVRSYSENGRAAKRGKVPWNKGMKMSVEHCEKLERGKAMAYARGDYVRFVSPTSLEHALSLLLQDAGLEFEAQKQFGKYTVDAWIPSHQLVFEADNGYWHSLRDDQEKRDSSIIEAGAIAVIHLSDEDLRPWRPR